MKSSILKLLTLIVQGLISSLSFSIYSKDLTALTMWLAEMPYKSMRTRPGPLRGMPVTARRRTQVSLSSLRAAQTASPSPPNHRAGEGKKKRKEKKKKQEKKQKKKNPTNNKKRGKRGGKKGGGGKKKRKEK